MNVNNPEMSTNSLFLLVVFIFYEEVITTYFTSQPQISPTYCLQHNMTLTDVTLLHCAFLCVVSNGCRVVAYKASTQTCMGCQYFMDQNYSRFGFDDNIDVPVEIPADSILYAPDASHFVYIGCYADCMLESNISNPCETRALPQMNGPDSSMTTEICFEYCQPYGSRYFGTQSSKWCFCGQVYDKVGVTDRCDSSCDGNSSQTCGGGFANSVYEIIYKE